MAAPPRRKDGTGGAGGSRLRRARLANMRQELLAPASAVLGHAEMLHETAVGVGAEVFLPDIGRIVAGARDLLGMVDRLLDPDALAAVAEGAVAALQKKLRHDLRNPINAIKGYAELLLEEALDAQAPEALREDIETVLGEAERLHGKIDVIVDFSTVGARAGTAEDVDDDAGMLAELMATLERIDQDRGEAPTGRILVVEDNESNRGLLVRRLSRDGHTVLAAESGRQALAILAAERVDVILLDLIMPDMNGFQVLLRLKEDPVLRDIPTIMISGIGEVDSVVRCIELGAEDFLQKPFNPVLLRARVGACLEKRRLREHERAYLAFNDGATGLPNRAHFLRELEMAVLRHSRHGLGYAVIRLSLNQSERVRESLGQAALDDLLVRIAEVIGGRLPGEAVLARVGDSDLAVLLAGEGDAGAAIAFAETVRGALARPLAVRGVEILAAVGVGIALSASGYETADEAMRDATAASVRSRAGGAIGSEVADRRMAIQAMERLKLESELRRGIERDELFLVYQPIVQMADRRVVGFEALVRWRHPERGLVSPGDFIPLAEQTGLIKPLGNVVLRQAASRIADWMRRYPEHVDLFMTVNVSTIQLTDPEFLPMVRELLLEMAPVSSRLIFEMTESILMQDPERAAQILEQLRTLNVASAIDDFGTGYSSLSYLNRFVFQKLKIDRSFVTDIDSLPRKQQIVQAMVLLARSLDMTVVAEGIETEAEAALVRKLGATYGQGYLFSRPMPAAEAERWLATMPAG